MGLIEREMLDEGFHRHPHPALARGHGFREGLRAAQVDDIRGRPREFCKRHQVMHPLRLHPRRTARVMLAGTGPAGREQFARALGDERLVLAMRGDDHPEFLRQRERAV